MSGSAARATPGKECRRPDTGASARMAPIDSNLNEILELRLYDFSSYRFNICSNIQSCNILLQFYCKFESSSKENMYLMFGFTFLSISGIKI